VYANPQCIPADIKNKIYLDCMFTVDKFKTAFKNQDTLKNSIDNLNANLKYMLEKDISSENFYKFVELQDQFRTIDGKNVIPWYNK
jgi:hypothetical protein